MLETLKVGERVNVTLKGKVPGVVTQIMPDGWYRVSIDGKRGELYIRPDLVQRREAAA